MGGGDLNTKKSWHPNTMKNQERVWKAEQAAAEEKKRILELQREREEETDRAQLKAMAQRNFGATSSTANDTRLHWMYDKPDKQAQQEDYLLGKAIGKSDENDQTPQNSMPALSRRVVGSSMTKTGDDSQVDLARKLREDPLLLVKERERAARAALLNNPLQRKKLTELLRKEQEHREQKQSDKKKTKKKGKDLDDILAAKLSALAGKKSINLNSLLNSDDSSDSTSSDEKTKKKKKKRKREKKSKKKYQSSESDTELSDDVDVRKNNKSLEDKTFKSHKVNKPETRKRKSDEKHDSDGETKRKKVVKHRNRRESESEKYKRKQELIEENGKSHKHSHHDSNKNKDPLEIKHIKMHNKETDKKDRQKRRSPAKREARREVSAESHSRKDSERMLPPRRDKQKGASPELPQRKNIQRATSPHKKYDEDQKSKKHGLSEEEKAARLAEMAAAGMEREVERGHRVARQRAEDAAAGAARASGPLRTEARALPDSLESRIHSNRHYIQRDRRHMDQHFARR